MRKLALLCSLLVLFSAPAFPQAGTHKVVLSWTVSADASSGYNIYRSTVSGGPYTKVNSAAIASTTFTDTGLAAGTYFYVATALAGSAESVNSNEAKAVILPAPPTVLSATPN